MKKIMFYSLTGTCICVASYLTQKEAHQTIKELSELYTSDRGTLKIEPITTHERVNFIP